MEAPRVIAPHQRERLEAQQTAAIVREQAFAGPDRWVGLVSTEPGEWSGWHHHGDHDTYFYLLSGSLEFEYGTAGATVAVRAGDFAHMPAQLVHRERTPPGEPVTAVLVRIGQGPTVINVDGPGG